MARACLFDEHTVKVILKKKTKIKSKLDDLSTPPLAWKAPPNSILNP